MHAWLANLQRRTVRAPRRRLGGPRGSFVGLDGPRFSLLAVLRSVREQIEVAVGRDRVSIGRDVFTYLLENSVAYSRSAYVRALDEGIVRLSDLQELARVAQVPYCLFFAPFAIVERQVELSREKLLQGVSKKTFSLNSRTQVALRDVDLILKDLIRKQGLLKQYDPTLVENPIVGLLRRPGRTPEQDGDILWAALGLDGAELRRSASKEKAVDKLVSHLEARQVLVSRSVANFMPQSLRGVKLSGITVKDRKVPYVFLAGGDHGDHSEPAGRQLFTLTLMAVLIARGKFAPVTYSSDVLGVDPGREYEIVGEMLMPAEMIRGSDLVDLDSVRAVADALKVTPSAVGVRAAQLNELGREKAGGLLIDLANEFAKRPTPSARQPKAVNAVRKYAGREFSSRMLDALDAGKLGKREFCRQVALNKFGPQQIEEFRVALR